MRATSFKPLDRNGIAKRAARDVPNGAFVNLGIGMPTLIADHVPPGREIFLHSENGIVGLGPPPSKGEEDWDVIDAGKAAATMQVGASLFDSATSFAIMRGGHLDIAALGAFEVSAAGDLANWSTGDGGLPAVGGAMDLASGAKAIWVLMEHTSKDGTPRLVEHCRYPLTAAKVVKRIYTSLAVIDVTPEGLVVREIVPGLDLAGLQTKTAAPLRAAAGGALELVV
jgi:3-oxoadipate CoA-transferase beta subunit